MTWNDYASNRFGGRETGTNAYTDATAVGRRGSSSSSASTRSWRKWASCRSGSTAARGSARCSSRPRRRCASARRASPPARRASSAARWSSSRPTRSPFPAARRAGSPCRRRTSRRSARPSQAAIAEVNANKAAFKGAWVLIPGASSGFARDGRRGSKLPDGSPEYLDAAMMPLLTKALVDAGALGTIQSATPPSAIQPDQQFRAAAQHPRRLRRVVGHAAGASRHQAAQHAVQRDQGARREGGAGRPRVRHPQLVQDGADQVPQRRRHPPRHDLPRRVHRHRRALRRASPAAPAASTTGRGSRPGWRPSASSRRPARSRSARSSSSPSRRRSRASSGRRRG